MIKFEGRIVQFGFGAVGKSFYEKLPLELQFNENNYYVITAEEQEFVAYVNMGGNGMGMDTVMRCVEME